MVCSEHLHSSTLCSWLILNFWSMRTFYLQPICTITQKNSMSNNISFFNWSTEGSRDSKGCGCNRDVRSRDTHTNLQCSGWTRQSKCDYVARAPGYELPRNPGTLVWRIYSHCCMWAWQETQMLCCRRYMVATHWTGTTESRFPCMWWQPMSKISNWSKLPSS